MPRSLEELDALMAEAPASGAPPKRSLEELDALMAGPAAAPPRSRSLEELDTVMASGPKDVGVVGRAWNSMMDDPKVKAIGRGASAVGGAMDAAYDAAGKVAGPVYGFLSPPERKPGEAEDVLDMAYESVMGEKPPNLKQELLEKATAAPQKGGFQRAVETLDKPGNAVRNTLERAASGTLGEAGITGALGEGFARRRVVSGQDVVKATEKAGWSKPNQGIAAGMKYLFGDNGQAIVDTAAGFAADVLTDPLTYVGGGLTKGGRAAEAVTTAARDARLFGRAVELPNEASVLGRALGKMTPEAQRAAKAGETLSLAKQAAAGQRAVITVGGVNVLGKTANEAIYSGMGKLATAVMGTEQAREFAQWTNRIFGSTLGMTNAERDLKRMDYFSRQEALAKMAQIRTAAQGERKLFDDTARRLEIDTSVRNRTVTDIWERGEIDAAAPKAMGGDGRLEPAEYATLKRYAKRNQALLDEGQDAGLSVKKLTHQELEYVHHLMTPEAMKWINANVPGPDLTTKVQRYLNKLQKDGNPGFARQRVSSRSVLESNLAAAEGGMVDKAGKAIKLLEDDPVVIMAAREMAQVKAVGAANLMDRIHEVFSVAAPTLGKGKSTLLPKQARELAEYRAGKLPASWRMDDLAKVLEVADEGRVIIRDGRFAGRAIGRDVYDFTERYAKATSPAEMSRALQAFDAVQGWWSMWTLAPRPAFHFRNGIGNLWNNALAGVYSPAHYVQAGVIQANKMNPEVLARMRIKGADGVVRSGNEVLELGMKLGVDKSGQFRGNVQTLRKELEPAGAIDSVNPLSKDMALIKLGGMTGEMVEGNARWAHFIAKLKEGLSPEAAAMSVKQHLFDYAELTDVERKVLKRLMPFYAWSRNNVPLQLHALRKNPGRFARFQQGKQEIEGSTGGAVPEEALPQWAADEFPIQTGRAGNKVGFMVLKNYFPAADIGPLYAAATGDPGDVVGEVASKLSPVLKTPLEIGINTDLRKSAQRGERVRIDRGHKVDLVGGRVDPLVAHALKTVATISAIDTLNPGNIFGEPSSAEKPDGAPATTNLLGWAGAERAQVRLHMGSGDTSRFGTFLGLPKTYPFDLERERVMRNNSLRHERTLIDNELKAMDKAHGSLEREELLKLREKNLERQRVTNAIFDKLR